MKILTVGASPYLLVRNGVMHADVICYLQSFGHEISSAVWHHDEGYFMPMDDGRNLYEKDGKEICELHPFIARSEQSPIFIYELMKKVKPDMIISIGDYKDTSFIYTIKAMYPTLFKWISICTFDCNGISPNYKESFEYADYVISTSNGGWTELDSTANVRGSFEPYGPNLNDYFVTKDISERNGFLCSSRNSQASNLPSFFIAAAKSKIPAKIHTNFYDVGDYNLDFLKTKYKADNVSLPENYCSIKDGPSKEEMRKIYNESRFIVDCSIKSATGLSLLEAMSCGCIPIGVNYGRIGEIISEMPEGFRMFVPYNIFVGQNEEEFAILSTEELAKIFQKAQSLTESEIKYASTCAVEIAKKYSNILFLKNLLSKVTLIQNSSHSIVLEC
jgi:glycosyltransferase involved in cell wall biosynthesis